MRVELRQSVFTPWAELDAYQSAAGAGLAAKFGATAVFVGTMRDYNDQHRVKSLFLEHYPGMTEDYLRSLAQQAGERHGLLDVLLLHRVGQVQPNEAIVLVACWSAHRGEALAAVREMMEELKSRAPFWKKEQRESGDHWVTHNTPNNH